jgi:hypothetical protein
MDAAEQTKLIAGAPLQLGRKVYVCPALNLKQLKMFKPELEILNKGMSSITEGTEDEKTMAYVACVAKVVTAALSRNYPDITEEVVEEGIDLSNIRSSVLSVLGTSGYRLTSEMEAEKIIHQVGESTGT